VQLNFNVKRCFMFPHFNTWSCFYRIELLFTGATSPCHGLFPHNVQRNACCSIQALPIFNTEATFYSSVKFEVLGFVEAILSSKFWQKPIAPFTESDNSRPVSKILAISKFRTFSAIPQPNIFLDLRNFHSSTPRYRGADKSLARPGRKQVTATEDFEFHISHL